MEFRLQYQLTRLVQSIKTDIGKPLDKSISISNIKFKCYRFIDQSIEIDTHNYCCSFEFIFLNFYWIYRFIDFIVFIKDRVLLTLINAKYRFFPDSVFKKTSCVLPMRLIRGLHLFYLGVLRPSCSLIAQDCTSTVLPSYNVLTVFNLNSF